MTYPSRVYMSPTHHGFHFFICELSCIVQEDSEVVSRCFLHCFELKIFLYILTTRARKLSLPCYLTNNWGCCSQGCLCKTERRRPAQNLSSVRWFYFRPDARYNWYTSGTTIFIHPSSWCIQGRFFLKIVDGKEARNWKMARSARKEAIRKKWRSVTSCQFNNKMVKPSC